MSVQPRLHTYRINKTKKNRHNLWNDISPSRPYSRLNIDRIWSIPLAIVFSIDIWAVQLNRGQNIIIASSLFLIINLTFTNFRVEEKVYIYIFIILRTDPLKRKFVQNILGNLVTSWHVIDITVVSFIRTIYKVLLNKRHHFFFQNFSAQILIFLKLSQGVYRK